MNLATDDMRFRQTEVNRMTRVIARAPEYLKVSERAPETLMRRMNELAVAAASPYQGFPLGRMKLRGELGDNTQANFDACVWFFELYAKNLRAIDSKSIAPQSMELGSKGQPPDPHSEKGKKLTRVEKRIARDYQSARLAGLACGAQSFGYFVAVVIEEQEPNWAMKSAVSTVAEALRRHKSLNSRHRAGNRA